MNKEKQTFRRRGRTGLVAALAAVLVLTMTVTFGEDIAAFFTSRLEPVTIEAAEAILGGFCGDISTDAPYMTDKFGNEVVSGPVMEKIAMGDAAVATLVEGYLYDVEAAPIVYEEYTYTLEQFIVDDKGMGLLAYTIENPNGVEYLEHGYGQVSVPLSPYLTTGAPFMDGEHADAYSYRLESSTETKLRLVMFFGTFREYSGEDFYFCITCDDEETEKVIPVGAIQLAPENLVPSTVFTDDCGNTVSLSPMGISTDWQQDYELLTYKLLLHHTDGTYTVKDEECNIYNARVGYWIAADDIGEHLLSSNYLFNCLIDVEAVTEVSLQGYCHPHGGEYTELQRVYVR
ncbi:MAG: hypothetical protein IKV99_08775 [Oscillospiraceae bacterium]|nr:hypothetical protein [Oscillospiraceae bacterium]